MQSILTATRNNKTWAWALRALLASSLFSLACSAEGGGGDQDCSEGFKCDIPEGPSEEMCSLRRRDAFNDNQLAFQRDFLRWSCADVTGVTNEDRGQEYCEYFAMVQIPDPFDLSQEEPTTHVLGRNLGEDYSFGTTEPRLELSDDDLASLEYDESAIVGQCIFTTWNSDYFLTPLLCEPEVDACPEVMGVGIDSEIFQMKFGVNSVEAAQILVEDCLVADAQGNLEDSSDPLHDDFYRGCMLNAEINETEYRKSDSTVCAASMRIAECGCTPVDPELNLGEYISPFDRRGFPLGTWSGAAELPAGCRYVDDGEGSQTLVTCDLSAGEVIMGSADLKGYCMDKYADNVVVHVPLPPVEAVSCDPSQSPSAYADSCGEVPWILSDY